MNMNPIVLEVLANKYCENCILRKNGKLLAARDKALEYNKYHFSSSIKTLFVAESPPTKFCEQSDRYFYAPGKLRYGTLFYFMMAVLFEDDVKIHKNCGKEHFLNKFKKEFYLIDMVKCPIDKLSRERKAKAIASCAEYLKRELHALKFQKLVFIGKGSFKRVEKNLDLDFRPIVVPLPFGSQRNVENFKSELKLALNA